MQRQSKDLHEIPDIVHDVNRSNMRMTHAREYYGDGLFEFIKNESNRELYKTAHSIITECNLWDWLNSYEVDEMHGYMFTKYDCDELYLLNYKLMEHPTSGLHSGASYGTTLRIMDYIAKKGYNNFRNKIENKNMK